MNKNLTRKDFLTNASKAAVGVTAIAGLSSLVTTASTKANTKVTPWPWPYQTLDPEAVRIQAHYLYWNGKDCCAGVFGAIANALAAAIGDPWTNMPMEIMLFGRGGGVGWGTICGCLNGGAALISLVTEKDPSTPLITELWGWYNQEELPTDVANTVATSGQYLVHQYDQELLQSISGSPLCHVSVTEWCLTAGKKVNAVERKERCARITGDIAAKTVELLNAHFAGTFTPAYVDPATLTACMVCHGPALLNNVMTKMDCVSCHGDPHAPTNIVSEDGGIPDKFNLTQNYPNPFNPSTKIQFALPSEDKVALGIYDITGQEIKRLVNHDLMAPGKYTAEWDGTDNFGNKVSSGIYFAKMTVGQMQKTIKMNLVK